MILFFIFFQSIVEFFPISSSGHLLMIKNIFFNHQPILNTSFFIFLHFASVFTTIFFFRKEIKNLLICLFSRNFIPSLFKDFRSLNKDDYSWLIILIFISCFPTFLIAGFFEFIFPQVFNLNLFYLGINFLITSIILLFGSFKVKYTKHNYHQIKIKDALIIGIFQGFAVIPGISRSGMTIVAALFLGINRQLSFTYSFLLSIPIILISTLIKVIQNPIPLKNYYSIFLFLIQIILSYISLRLMTYLFIQKNRLSIFSYICFFSFSICWIYYFFN